MTTLLLCLALQDPRVTLEVKDEPLGVAAVLALAPFGDQARWPDPPLALRRVSFTLKNAGYLEVLDTLGEAGGYGRVLTPHHPFLEGSPNECISWGSPGSPLLALDLTASVRLLAWASATRDAAYLDLWVIAPPGTPRRNARFQGPALQVDLEPWQFWTTGNPVRFSARAALPSQRTGDTFTLEGELMFEGGRPLRVASGPLVLPPLSDPAEPPPEPPASLSPGLWAFLFGGLALVVGLLYLALRHRRVTN